MGAHSHIKQLRKQFGQLLLLLMIGAPMFIGCAVHRDLRISEVGLHAVELYLAEDSGNQLALADHTLTYKNSNGLEGEVDLGVFGTLPGGGWLVVWEEQNYSDPPEKEDFVNFFGRSVPGIKVSDGFFGIGISYSYRVSGKHRRGFITDKTDDVVKFGVQPRPSIGGSFIEDGSLANKVPSQSRTISRKWGIIHPIDNDREDDWIKKTQSFGGPTLP
jgi:hypothetical protein